MIVSLTLKNFRNFSNSRFDFEQLNLIIGQNGKGKTNIIEALSLFTDPLIEVPFEAMTQLGENFFYIACESDSGETVSLYYEKESKKKTYKLGQKSTTKTKISSLFPKIIGFHPLSMNILYLGPSERRNFIDEILIMTHPTYKNTLILYKKVLGSRNKLLKNISEGKSSESELDFWDTRFIELAKNIYKIREELWKFFEKHIDTLVHSLSGKTEALYFIPLLKGKREDIEDSLKEYLKKNRQRDIMIRKTQIGPHIDDFDIHIDNGISLTHFASRGEVKSILLGLKFLAVSFIEQETDKKPLFLVDDLLSELDEPHRKYLLQKFHDYQIFLSSIEELNIPYKKIYL